MTTPPIQAIGALPPVDGLAVRAQANAPQHTSFDGILTGGLEQVNQQLLHADAEVTAFALDDSIPLHQVTFALEQARLSFELMLQVRTKLVEGFQDLARMQL